MELILKRDRDGASDNIRLGIDLYRRGWRGDRQGILDLLSLLDQLPQQEDKFDPAATTQLGVWRVVRSMFGVIIPLPISAGAVHAWHPDAVEAARLQNELAPQPAQLPPHETTPNWAWPLVGERTGRRPPLPELGRDENRERQSRYCQGFDPDWWIPALLAAKWQTSWYPKEPTRAAVEQWVRMIDEMRVEYLGPWGMPGRATELEAERENDLALIREHAPHLLQAEPVSQRTQPDNPPQLDTKEQTSAPSLSARVYNRLSPPQRVALPALADSTDHALEHEATMTSTGQQSQEFTGPLRVGVITALPHETAAVLATFGDPCPTVVPGAGAGRRYWLAKVGMNGRAHEIVIAQADMGNNLAGIRASLLLNHFPSIESIVMCGIAGGIPSPERPSEHVRLGDVVVSNQKGVVQYDFVKRTVKRKRTEIPEEVRASPRPPSAELVEAVRLLEVETHFERFPWIAHLDAGLDRLRWRRPDDADDRLADPADPSRLLAHPEDSERRPGRPRVFLAPIASANTLLKDPVKRDALRGQFGTRAVEMEGSGVADATWTHGVGYLVVRGICDYCDSNKNDLWQKYAAMTAAAYVRALLESMLARAQ
jgi:nucleoside phosphorylase